MGGRAVGIRRELRGVMWILAIVACAAAMELGWASRRVPLYPSSMGASMALRITERLDVWKVPYSMVDGRILVAARERPRIVGALLAAGLPPPPGRSPSLMSGSPMEKSEGEARRELVQVADEVRHLQGVTDAQVTRVRDEDALGPPRDASYRVRLTLAAGFQPAGAQVQAIQAHLAWRFGLDEPGSVRIVDDQGREWASGRPSPAPRARPSE